MPDVCKCGEVLTASADCDRSVIDRRSDVPSIARVSRCRVLSSATQRSAIVRPGHRYSDDQRVPQFDYTRRATAFSLHECASKDSWLEGGPLGRRLSYQTKRPRDRRPARQWPEVNKVYRFACVPTVGCDLRQRLVCDVLERGWTQFIDHVINSDVTAVTQGKER
jgi:hypothetical protein